MTAEIYASSQNHVRSALEKRGIDFEGRGLPVSLRPTVISARMADEIKRDLSVVRHCINRLIETLRANLHSRKDSLLVDFFSFYEKWYPMILREQRDMDDIMLMRFDTARTARHVWKAMEPNSACPGGVIHCAFSRDAWASSKIGRALCSGLELVTAAIDDPYYFVRFLDGLTEPRGSRNVAICNDRGVYTHELDSLQKASEKLQSQGVTAGRIVVCDARDIRVDKTVVLAAGTPVGLIYNKLDPLAVDPEAPDLQHWIAASRADDCDFLNSFGAFYIGEAKSVFAALWREDIQREIGVSAKEKAAIKRRICRTRRVCDLGPAAMREVIDNRHKYVLKEDAVTRGIGVVVGHETDARHWADTVDAYRDRNGVVQEAIDIPMRATLEATEGGGRLEGHYSYFGADAFFFGVAFAGMISRCHSSSVFNVGKGGQAVPMLVVRPRGLREVV